VAPARIDGVPGALQVLGDEAELAGQFEVEVNGAAMVADVVDGAVQFAAGRPAVVVAQVADDVFDATHPEVALLDVDGLQVAAGTGTGVPAHGQVLHDALDALAGQADTTAADVIDDVAEFVGQLAVVAAQALGVRPGLLQRVDGAVDLVHGQLLIGCGELLGDVLVRLVVHEPLEQGEDEVRPEVAALGDGCLRGRFDRRHLGGGGDGGDVTAQQGAQQAQDGKGSGSHRMSSFTRSER